MSAAEPHCEMQSEYPLQSVEVPDGTMLKQLFSSVQQFCSSAD